MTYLMWSAAAFMGLTTAVHLFLGTGEVMTPILAAETIHPVIRATALVVWHMISFILAISTVALIYLAKTENQALAVFVMLLQFGFAVIFLAVNIATFGTVLNMPQWSVFLLVAALICANLFISNRKSHALSSTRTS